MAEEILLQVEKTAIQTLSFYHRSLSRLPTRFSLWMFCFMTTIIPSHIYRVEICDETGWATADAQRMDCGLSWEGRSSPKNKKSVKCRRVTFQTARQPFSAATDHRGAFYH